MRHTILLVASWVVLTGCGVPFVYYNAAEVQQDKYFYVHKAYPKTKAEQLQIQLSAYKTRCGLIQAIEHSPNFEKISESEHALFVQGPDGINTVMRIEEIDGVSLRVWSRAPRVAKYMVNAVENGECKSSVWE